MGPTYRHLTTVKPCGYTFYLFLFPVQTAGTSCPSGSGSASGSLCTYSSSWWPTWARLLDWLRGSRKRLVIHVKKTVNGQSDSQEYASENIQKIKSIDFKTIYNNTICVDVVTIFTTTISSKFSKQLAIKALCFPIVSVFSVFHCMSGGCLDVVDGRLNLRPKLGSIYRITIQVSQPIHLCHRAEHGIQYYFQAGEIVQFV